LHVIWLPIDLIQEETLMNNINSSIDSMSTLYVGKKISTIAKTKKNFSCLKMERERDVIPIKRSFKFVSINQR
jgi:hypothetical protein